MGHVIVACIHEDFLSDHLQCPRCLSSVLSQTIPPSFPHCRQRRDDQAGREPGERAAAGRDVPHHADRDALPDELLDGRVEPDQEVPETGGRVDRHFTTKSVLYWRKRWADLQCVISRK